MSSSRSAVVRPGSPQELLDDDAARAAAGGIATEMAGLPPAADWLRR